MYAHSYSFNPDLVFHVHASECTVRLLNRAGKNLCETPGFEHVTSGLTGVCKPVALPPEQFNHGPQE